MTNYRKKIMLSEPVQEDDVFAWQMWLREPNGREETIYDLPGSGDDTYFYTDDFAAQVAADPSRATLIDTAGNDTINAAATTYDARIDLRASSPTSIIAGQELTIVGTIENAIGGDGDDTLIGNHLGNTLRGGRGDDRLFSSGWLNSRDGSLDVLDGGDGDDALVITHPGFSSTDPGSVRAIGGTGTDTLSFHPVDFLHFPELGFTADLANGTGSFGFNDSVMVSISEVENVTGGSGDDKLFGDAGANRLDGGLGQDLLVGRGGDDVYGHVDASDTIVEEAGGGHDHVSLRYGVANYSLGANLEDLTLESAAILVPDPMPRGLILGNELGNRITGNEDANAIDGGDGRDTIYGGGSNDVIVGGLGADRLSGGAGADLFVFRSIAEVGGSVSRPSGDVIVDFDSGAQPGPVPWTPGSVVDRIDLSMIDANTATAADDAFTLGLRPGGLGQLNIAYGEIQDGLATRAVTYLYADVTGDRAPDFSLTLHGHVTFTAGNFIL